MLKLSLAVLLYFQLSTYVLAQRNLTEEAQNAFQLLGEQLDSSLNVVFYEAPKLWSDYIKNVSEALEESSANDVKQLRSIINNIATVASNFSSTKQCLDVLLSTPGSYQNIFLSEQIFFDNLLHLATVNVLNSGSQYAVLFADFLINCVDNNRNCEGRSRAVLAEVERQLPLMKRIPYELLTEIHLLGYKLQVHLENAHTNLWEIYNRAVQNITVCVISKINDGAQITEPAPAVPGGIETAYEVLKYVVDHASLDHSTTLLINSVQTQASLDNGSNGIISLITISLNALSSFYNTAEDFNVTLDCSFSSADVLPIVTSSLTRASSESRILVSHLQKQYDEAVAELDAVGAEVRSIELEIQGCSDSISCDYLLERIASKQTEILWRMERATSSALVLFQQTVTAVKENGARIARNAIDELQIGVTDFKNCVQYSLV